MRLNDADDFFRNYPELDNEPYNNAPTVEVGYLTNCANCERVAKIRAKRPHGKWIVAEDCEYVMKCSNCNEDAEYLEGGSQFLSKYCPNCGAKMENSEN